MTVTLYCSGGGLATTNLETRRTVLRLDADRTMTMTGRRASLGEGRPTMATMTGRRASLGEGRPTMATMGREEEIPTTNRPGHRPGHRPKSPLEAQLMSPLPVVVMEE